MFKADDYGSIHSNDTIQQNLASDHSTSSESSIAHSFIKKKSLKRSKCKYIIYFSIQLKFNLSFIVREKLILFILY